MTDVDLDDLLDESAAAPDPAARAGEGGRGCSSTQPRPPSPAATAARSIIGTGRVRRQRLKCLTQRHKIMVGLHLQGKSSREIAQIMGCSANTVISVVNDPLAQEVIAHYYEGVESELKALMPKAVDAIRTALDAPDTGTKLKGVDRFAKLSGVGEREPGAGVTVNVIQTARERFVDEVRAAQERVNSTKKVEGSGRGKVIEGEYEIAAE